MKTRSYVIFVITILVAGIFLSAGSYADGRHHGHGGSHHWRGHGWGGHYYGGDSFSLGLGFVFPLYSYGYPYDYPVYGPPYYPAPAQVPPSASLPDQAPYTVSQEEEPAYCREYTKKIIVDGKEEMAYGTACLQDDGSWRIMN